MDLTNGRTKSEWGVRGTNKQKKCQIDKNKFPVVYQRGTFKAQHQGD